MYSPSKHDFLRLAKMHRVIPVFREIIADAETPVSAFQKLSIDEHSFLLESVEGGERLGRYSFLGCNPSKIVISHHGKVSVEDGKGKEIEVIDDNRDPLDVLKEMIDVCNPAIPQDLPPFFGGAVGYLNYDSVRHFEDIPKTVEDDLDLPEMVFMFVDTILIFDHLTHRVKIVANVHLDQEGTLEDLYDKAVERIESVITTLSEGSSQLRVLSPLSGLEVSDSFSSNMTKDQFEEIVEKAKNYIKTGDILQVVLSQRLEADVTNGSFDIYRALRTINPAPYMYYLRFKDFEMAGSSPEPLVKVEGKNVMTCPIAGTRPRGENRVEDENLKKELLADEKERAEHIMLVDLGRNDLGRVCQPGSVKVDDLMYIETYSHVMHIVSMVTGILEDDKDAFDALRACFPAGTVTGAPKIRAMEIIDELESTMRGPYAGVVGYIGYSGDLDTCITIRTIVIRDNKAYIQAGAGIVYDSVPANEYEETKHKAMALMNAIAMAEQSAGLKNKEVKKTAV